MRPAGNGHRPPRLLKKRISMELTDQEIYRRQALVELDKLGINPYPAPEFKVNVNTAQIKAEFREDTR